MDDISIPRYVWMCLRVTFPIYNCGKIQFRGGVPAISTRCCCWLVPCCSDCYFPVANRINDIPTLGSNGAQLGGPSTITGLYTEIIETIEGEVDPWTIQTWTQNGESSHAIQYNFISTDPDCDYYSLQSRCFWTVPLHFTYEFEGTTTEGDINAIVTYSSVAGWTAVLDGGISLTPDSWNQFGCSGSFSWTFTGSRFVDTPAPGFTVNSVQSGSFYAAGGKPWPDGFVCNIASNLQGLFNVAENRLAVTTDLPDGYFD